MWLVLGYIIFITLLAVVHAIMTLLDVEPSAENVKDDLECIERCFDTEHLLSSNAVGTSQTKMYYEATARHFAWLERRVGGGMHSSLRMGPGMPERGVQVAMVMQVVILLVIANSNAKRVLELGCGRGFCTHYLAQLMPYVDFLGIDIVEEHIDEARRRTEALKFQRVNFETLDMMHIDELGMEFDVVFAIDSAAHVSTQEGRERLCRGIYRVLRDQGRFVLIDRFRGDRFEKASEEQQRATELVERALMIGGFGTKQQWALATKRAGLVHTWSRDFTAQAYGFWVNAWRGMRLLLRFPTLVWLFGTLSADRAMETTHILALSTMAHAMRNGVALQYGMMTFEAKFKKAPF